ncbi:MAG: AAA family ATPase, partial [Oscillospiraceae bacterium]|nr:AAA family ATPase [Oscillospiraceae bacterium]
YLRDLLALLDLKIFFYYNTHRWLGPDSQLKDMLGIALSKQEFEHNLTKSERKSLLALIDPESADEVQLMSDAIELRLRQTTAEIPLSRLFESIGLDEFERNCVLLAYASEDSTKYGKLFAYLQDDIALKRPTRELAIALFMPEINPDGSPATAEEYALRFDAGTLFASLFDMREFKNGVLTLKPSAAGFITSGKTVLPKGYELFDGAAEFITAEKIDASALETLSSAAKTAERGSFIQICGGVGRGKRFLLRSWAKKNGAKCLFADVSAAEDFDLRESAMLARLCGAYLALHSFEAEKEISLGEDYRVEDVLLLNDLSALEAAKPVTFLLASKPQKIAGAETAAVIALAPLTASERLTMFSDFAGDAVTPDNLGILAQTYRFEPGQIKSAVRQILSAGKLGGSLGLRELNEICSAQVTTNLDKLATKLSPKHSWSDIVLPKAQLDILKHACLHISKRHKVYTEWGFEQNLSYGTGLSILMYGAPGTGKTMCAEILASELKLDVFRINISRIVSKYIGETEKNLAEIFSEAKKTGGILFFDECEALFGKRSDVKDSHDRNANIEVAYLLQQIEEHDGITLMSTNIKQNIDPAFMRRITYAVRFPFPEAPARKAIYLKLLPKELPLAKAIDWDYLAEKFPLSGGYIKNIVLSAAFGAANDDKPLSMKHLLIAALRELKKNDIVIVRENYREYADLLSGEFEDLEQTK